MYIYNPVEPLARALTDEEEEEFREYARTHDPLAGSWVIYHPVCRKVWRDRGFGPPDTL